MIRFFCYALLLLSPHCLLAVPALAGEAGDPPLGLWKNPKGTVVVRTDTCGTNLCGTVV